AFTAKTPNYVNQYGFDADLVDATGRLGNSATLATIRLTSTQDEYYPDVVTFATDLYAPVFASSGFTKTVADLNGAPVRPGDVLEYTLTMRNSGQDHATQCVLRDTLPANATYVAGSLQVASGPNAGGKTDAAGDDQMEYDAANRVVIARLGTGANAASGGQINVGVTTSVKFRVQVTPPAPTGTAVSNQGGLAFTGALSGMAFTARSDADTLTAGAQPTVVTTVSAPISGTGFEDPGYGGGAGRPLAASGGAGVAGARVELYDASGNLRAATLTGATGAYAFDGWSPGGYQVRVVNAGVASSRPGGGAAGLVPVQTFRTDASVAGAGGSGTATPVPDHVGGESPWKQDAPANLANANLAALNTATTFPQSVAVVALGTNAVPGVDFGFNFDTIVNVNDAGQGSLRQFLLNANALGNAGLAQQGLAPGAETSVFMVSGGVARAGLRAGLPGLLVNGVARIRVQSPLPALTDPGTRVDGGTQTANVGDTNPVLLGAGSAGVDALPLASVPGPEVEVSDSTGVGVGFDLEAANLALVHLAITGFGNAAGSDADADVRVGAPAAGAWIQWCALGSSARSFTDPGAALRSGGDHVRALGAAGGTLRDCALGFGAGSGAALTAGANGWQLADLELLGNAVNPAVAQLAIAGSGGAAVSQCVISGGGGAGMDAATSTGGCTFTNLSVQGNGRGPGAATAGLRVGGAGGTLDRCIVNANYGAGVQVVASGSNWVLTRNSIFRNGTAAPFGGGPASGQIGIDLQGPGDDPGAGTPPYVTPNDPGDADAGGNARLNFPVLAAAVLANGSFTLSGWSPPGATIELFVSDGAANGFGQGRTYVGTFVEGSAADLDAGTSGYGPVVNGLPQGSDVTNRFRFTLPAPAGVAAGVTLTATGTVAGTGTSEFSGVVTVTTGVTLSGFAYADANHNAQRDAGEAGTGATLYAKLVAGGGSSASQVAGVDPATGAYALTAVTAGAWTVVLDDNAAPADVTPAVPAGWLATENPAGAIAVGVNATDVANLDFGLFAGSMVSGAVFRDDGAGGGTANDGAPEGGEAGLAGVRVRLAGAACAGGACDSALTDGAGAFTLWLPAAAAGAVSVRQADMAGWLSTGGGEGTTGGAFGRAADAVSFTAAPGVAYAGLRFGDVPANAWAAGGARSVSPGAVAFYPHTFTAGSAGSVTVGAAETPSPALPGWSAQLYRDLNCNGVLDPGEPPLAAPVALAAGQSLCVILRHATPAGAPPGADELVTLTASFAYANATPALGANAALGDVTTIAAASGLVLAKSVDRASARPGDFLVYTITYSNPGGAPLTSIVIRDATPPWTVFDSATCAAAGSGITGCTLAQSPAPGASGALQWTLAGALAPGGSGSVTFRVRVQ
ncbi:MAG TPA: SdrD B-like domain-containing protein, partial [Candidatus Eisenbacteria bacterium]|nr:SdrD B-like domain-containing protein [Candidatus Eisenbacteria bacterium]